MTQKLDWRLTSMNRLNDNIEQAKELAKDFADLSKEFALIAEELEKGGACKHCNSTEKANQIRALLAERNRVVKTIKESVKDLTPHLKASGIIIN